MTDWNNNTTNFAWTANGQLATQTDPNGVTENRAYDTAGQLTNIATAAGSTALASYGYGYDAAGEITSDTTTDPITTATRSYSHDLLNQLTTVTTGSATGTYTASSAGLLTGTPTGDTLAYNPAQELTSRAPATGPTTNYTYDANGSRSTTTIAATSTTSAATTAFAYTAAGDLTAVTLPGATAPSVTYTTDGDGLRQTRTDSASARGFLWDTAGTLPLLLDDGNHAYLYGPSSTPIAQIDDTSHAVEYLHGDNVGSIRLITNATGAVTATNEYDPFGNRTGHTGTSDSQIGYTGNWTDPATDLVYLRARDYDPTTAQFLTIDPLVDQTHQPYAYVANNPLNATDPSGLCVGMDGTPQDRQCTSNDFFWAGLGPSLAHEFHIAQAGFNDGATFGLASQFGLVDCSAKSDNLYWVEYGIGAVVMTAATFGTGAIGEGATREGLSLSNAASQEAKSAVTSEASAAARAANEEAYKYATQADKLDHIFADKHNFGPLVQQFGSREAVVQEFLAKLAGQTPEVGKFESQFALGGQSVVVRGAVVNGVVKIGTAFTPGG